MRVRSLQIYICKSQCHFLSLTCLLIVTNRVTGNSWCHPVKTVTHKKVLLELEFSPGHEDVPSMLSWSWEMPRITSHNRLPFEHENNLPHLTWLYWLIPVDLLVKDDESLPCFTPYGCLLSTEHVERTIILFLSIELPVVYHKLKYWILHAENFISNMPHILYWKLHNLMFTVLSLLCLFAYITYSFVQHPYTYCVVRNLAIKTSSFHGKQQCF